MSQSDTPRTDNNARSIEWWRDGFDPGLSFNLVSDKFSAMLERELKAAKSELKSLSGILHQANNMIGNLSHLRLVINQANAEIERLTKVEAAAKAYVSEVDQMPVNMTVAILSEYFIELKKALAEHDAQTGKWQCKEGK